MGHTLSTVTQNYQRFLVYVQPFRRALRKSDQLALDNLLDQASQHLPAAGYAANLMPGIAFLLALLLEKHKQVGHLESELEDQRKDFRRDLENYRVEFAAELGKLRAEIFLLKGSPNGH
jgi:hypothetical protein